MTDPEQVAEWFEASRSRLRAIAYRMLGSLSDVEDALQETWLRASAARGENIENPASWLSTIMARVCLNVLRARQTHPEVPMGVRLPDPIISRPDAADPEQEALLAESIGLALLVVLQTLAPAERLAFVLHDVFDLPFEEISSIIERSPAATRQLASRARRRMQHEATTTIEGDLGRQRQVVDAFFTATRQGDLQTLVTLLDPEVVLRADFGHLSASRVVRGASEVLDHLFTPSDAVIVPALINRLAGAVIFRGRQPFAVMAFMVRDGRIVEIDALADRDRLRGLALEMIWPAESASASSVWGAGAIRRLRAPGPGTTE